MSESTIKENLKIALQKIDEAKKVSGLSEVTLIGVTKTREPSEIAELIMAGCDNIGENRVQEWEGKASQVQDYLIRKNYSGKYTAHLVGHLQSNKARKALAHFDMIQSVDRLELAERLGRIAEEESKSPFPCLIQVKLGEEETKAGIEKDILIREFEKFIDVTGIRIQGLMLIAPLWAIGDDARPYFSEMRELFKHFSEQKDNRFEMKHLSMGMSADFDIAVEEGANMVRIGRALFDGFDAI